MFVVLDAPVITFLIHENKIIDGSNYSLGCTSDSNPPTAVMAIEVNSKLIKRCNGSSCGVHLQANRTNNGEYFCRARNNDSEDKFKTTNISILCKLSIFPLIQE